MMLPSLPAALDPRFEVRALGADRRVVSVARQDDGVVVEGEQLVGDRPDDRAEVGVVEMRCTGTAGEERVAGEEQRSVVKRKRDRARRVARVVDRVEPQLANFDHLGVVEEHVVAHLGELRCIQLGDRYLVARLAHCRDRLDVVPMAVGLQDTFDAERIAQLEEALVFVGCIEQDRLAGCFAAHDEDIVLVRADDHLVNLGVGVGPVQCLVGRRWHWSSLPGSSPVGQQVVPADGAVCQRRVESRGTVRHVARRTKIIATIGPASEDEATLEAMIDAGMNVARIALAHTPLDEALVRHQRVRDVAKRMGAIVGTLVDLPGSKIRIGRAGRDGFDLAVGDSVTLVVGDEVSTAERIEINYPHLVDDCHVGDEITFAGSVVLTVQRVEGSEIIARVESGGTLSGRSGVYIPFGSADYRPMSDEDRVALAAFVEVGVDMVALSVNAGRDLRELGVEPHPRGPMVIAKIETLAAVENLPSIIEDAAGILVARGALGREAALEELPHLQKQVIRDCIAGGLPVITATQMLDSMVIAQAPTRAEATDIANAVFDGTSAVMLSAETAVGNHPALVVETMARIAERSDDQFNHTSWAERVAALRMAGHEHSEAAVTDAMTIAAARACKELKVRAVICISGSGFTVRSMARFRPSAKILGFSSSEATVRQLASSWGVTPVLFEGLATDYEERVRLAVNQAKRERHVVTGDLIGVVAGISSTARATDTFRLLRVS